MTSVLTPTTRRRVRQRVGRLVRAWQGRVRRGRGRVRTSSEALRAPARRARRLLARCTPLRMAHRRARRASLARRTERVPIDRLLLGGENGHTARELARATGDVMRASTRVVDGPHVDILRRFADQGVLALDADALKATPYVQHGLACVAATGDYFGAHDEAGVLEVARDFLAVAAGERPSARPGRSAVGDPIRVRRIRHSDCFQVVDGHHRIALAVAAGLEDLDVAVEPGQATTPLQDLLLSLRWTAGRRELYQPIAAPELEREWTLVRRCTDRLAMMTEFLGTLDVPSDGASYLDVGACYGWYVAQMTDLGFDGHGIELDPNAIRLGTHAYGLEPSRMSTGECSDLLRALDRRYDVVSCFSVLHHFAMGNGPCSAEVLAGLLDRATGHVLFLDTGEAHEAWFRELLPAWNTEHIVEWLRRHTTFRRVVALGTDHDDVPPFEDNYGRTLFACLR